jgi:hypothetical protein
MPRKRETLQGLYEDPKGSGIWWIQHFDLQRRRRREKVGRREVAINLLAIRRTEKLEGESFLRPDKKFLSALYVLTPWNTRELRIRAKAPTILS